MYLNVLFCCFSTSGDGETVVSFVCFGNWLNFWIVPELEESLQELIGKFCLIP